MTAGTIGYSFAVVAGLMAALLFQEIIRRNFRKSKELYLLALLMSMVCFSGIEWGLWLEGNDMFRLLLYPSIPLDFFFAAWIGFSIWVGEKLKERKIVITWLFLLAVIFMIANYCMNCVHF